MSELLLGVNVDHIATLREARGTNYPDPVYAASVAEHAGADGITVHLREDRRHIQDRDIHVLKQTLHTRMNLEMAVTDEMLEIACEVKPAFCCLVPEKREELTTEGGLDVLGNLNNITRAVSVLSEAGIETSLFIDADKNQIDAAIASRAPYIEIHTGQYAEAATASKRNELLDVINEMSHFAYKQGLIVNAGHGLNEHNVADVAAIPVIYELNIGHALIAKAMIIGLSEAVKEMKQLINFARA